MLLGLLFFIEYEITNSELKYCFIREQVQVLQWCV